MRDKDTRMLEEMVQEKYESLFSGKIEEEDEDTSLGANDNKDEDKDEKDEKDEDEKDDKSEDSDSDKDEGSDDDSDDSDDSKEDSDDDDDSEDKGFDSEDSDSAGGDSGIQSKVKQLQKQYNDLLIDAFEKYAADCIENALDGVESAFGENITDILDGALQELKGKILGDLGVEDTGCCGGMEGPMGDGPMGGEPMGGMEVDMGGEPEVEFGAKVGGIPTITVDTEEGSDDEGSEESDDLDDEDKEVEEEACGIKRGKKKKIMKESTLVADFYGFVE